MENRDPNHPGARQSPPPQDTVQTSSYGLGHVLVREQAAQSESRKSSALFLGLLESAPDGIVIVDGAGRILLVNAQTERLFGYSRDELLGKTVEILLPDRFHSAHGSHRQTYVDRPTTRPMGVGLDLIARRRDGSEFPVEISLSPIETEDGVLVTSIIRDITDRKLAEEELRRLNAELEWRVLQRTRQFEEANRELEAFCYSISHDLRAPLRHLSGSASLLQKRASSGLDERSLRYVTNIVESAEHMGRLLDDLLAFSRMGRSDMIRSRVSLDRLVLEAQHDLQPDIEGRNIVWNIGPLPDVEGDPMMLRLVFVNLISNALKYTGTRDEARIEIGSKSDESGGIVVFVRDNGVGFDMQYLDKLFGVFQRLHRPEDFPGTGIGLATVRRIIHRHGGRTWAEGTLGSGATFSFYLPATGD